MTCEEPEQEIISFPDNISDTVLKRKCLDTILRIGLPKDQVTRFLPPNISNFLLKNLSSETDISSLISSSSISRLDIGKDQVNLPTDSVRDLLASRVQILSLENCSLPSKLLESRDLLSSQSEYSQLNTLIINNVFIPVHDEKFIKSLGTLMGKITNLKFGSVMSNDSIQQSDEIFIKFARDFLSNNYNLRNVDLRGSDVDIVAVSSRRNLSINFAGELRRWARRLRGFAFETDLHPCRVLRILNRQCFLLKSICFRTSGQQRVSDVFDNLRTVLDVSESIQLSCIEPLLKLKRLCLCGHFKTTDNILRSILPSLPNLKYLNVCGCAVNFDQYWYYLPPTLEELILDEFDREILLKFKRSSVIQLLKKCPNLTIYLSSPLFDGEELESLRGLALLNGANCILSDNFDILSSDDGLITFELRVKQLEKKSCCIKLF